MRHIRRSQCTWHTERGVQWPASLSLEEEKLAGQFRMFRILSHTIAAWLPTTLCFIWRVISLAATWRRSTFCCVHTLSRHMGSMHIHNAYVRRRRRRTSLQSMIRMIRFDRVDNFFALIFSFPPRCLPPARHEQRKNTNKLSQLFATMRSLPKQTRTKTKSMFVFCLFSDSSIRGIAFEWHESEWKIISRIFKYSSLLRLLQRAYLPIIHP